MNTLTLATFNIRCFGFNGDYFAQSPSESRLDYLKAFIANEYSDVDVFVLQEIMDHSVLEKILPEGYKFYKYNHDYPRHMHVVLCCRQDLDFEDVVTVPNTTLDETKSRPAIYGRLVKDNRTLMHVVGVHLKSGYEHTKNRVKQAEAISDFLKAINPDEPILITGDFNSHLRLKTGKKQDDIYFLNEVFSQCKLRRVDQTKSTYVTAFEQAFLDHFWTNRDAKSISVYDIHKYSQSNSVKTFFDQISDHLPVKISIDI